MYAPALAVCSRHLHDLVLAIKGHAPPLNVEMPHGLVPLCSDGEVEEFRLVPVGEVLRSLREDLPLWKPNSALVAIDFCVRHGLIEPSEPGYLETVALLRVGRGSIV